MIVTRWQASVRPSSEDLKLFFQVEGLEAQEEVLFPGQKVNDHRHPLSEIRIVIDGALFMNIAGNQLLLRPGDRIEIPANTKHSHSSEGDVACTCLTAFRPL